MAAAVNAFLLELLEDEEAGNGKSLADYQRRYPGFEDAIAAEFAKLGRADTIPGAPSPAPTSVVERFEAVWKEDVAAGRVRPLAEYIRRFPGAELAVAEHYAGISTGGTGSGIGSSPGAGVGERFGPYRIESELGRGGQGAVYLARDERTDRRVALKVLTGRALSSPEALLRFRREATVASRVDHPGVCTVYESDAVDGVPYVAMRFVEGETLSQRIAAMRRARVRGEDGPDRAAIDALLAIIEQAARAVHAAHEEGVVHRDLNPSNLMIEGDETTVVLDFGLAGDLEVEGSGLTQTGDVFGTPSYMAPEQLSNTARPDRRTDVYSLGVTLFECVTLRRPFEGPTREQLYRQILDARPIDPRKLNRHVGADLAVVIATATAKEPDARYHSAELFADDLEAVRESRSITARPPSLTRRAVRWVRREPILASLIVTLALVATLASSLAGYLLRSRPELVAGAAELGRVELERAVAEIDDSDHERVRVAREKLVRLVARHPTDTLARCALVLGTLALGRDEEALRILRATPRGIADQNALDRLEVFTRRRLGDETNAADLARHVTESKGPIELYVEGSLLLRFARKPEAALPKLRDAVNGATRPELTYHATCLRAALEVGDLDTAASLATGLVGVWPNSAIAQLRAASVFVRTDPDRAVDCYERTLELDPQRPDALLSLSTLLQRRGESERAAELHRRLMAVARSDVRDRYRTIRFTELVSSREHERCVLEARDALAVDPGSDVAHRFLVASLRELGRHADVAAEATRLIERSANPPLALLELRAEARTRAGDHAGAIADTQRMIERIDASSEPDLERRAVLARSIEALGRANAEAAVAPTDDDPDATEP